MRKRLIFAFVLALCAALLCVGAWAAGETPSTAGDTCAISNAEELKNFRDEVNSGSNFEGKTVVLANDIDLGGSEDNPWTPIGYSDGSDVSLEFAGTFDGQGHTISGLYINSEATYAGLFGVVGEDGTVTNLTVKGDVTNKGKFTGGVIGYNLGAVENCAFTGTVNGGGGTGDSAGYEHGNYTGGVAGINYGTITNCRNSGTVKGNDKDTGAQSHTGGVAGENIGAVEDCCNTGAVTGSGSGSSYFTYAGGVAGDNMYDGDGSDSGTITNCRNSGTVIGNGGRSRTGGVAGGNCNDSPEPVATITNCYNTGNVTGTGSSSRTGGVVGCNSSAVHNCYSTGKVTGSIAGGVAGNNNGGTIKNCYYLTIDGLSDSTATAKTEEDFESGAVARLLGDAYGQTLGEDDFPQLIALDPDAPRVYRVTFDFNDGDVTPNQVSYTNGTVTPPADPSAAGKTFAGWYTEDNRKLGTFKIAADTTFTARFTEDAAGVDIPTAGIDIDQTEGGTVDTNLGNASAGATITVTVTPDEGYEVGGVTVTGSDGEIPVERVDETTYTFTMPDGPVSIDVTFVPATGGFSDIVPGAWYVDAVNYVVANGLMEGTSATTFEPEARMTRAMFWTILARIDGETITGSTWADAARAWAMANGVSDGTNPHSPLTREQLVTMLWRYLGEPSTTGTLSAYTDANAVSTWAKTAMAWAVNEGVITGVTTTTLAPQSAATRAQCATILMRNAL